MSTQEDKDLINQKIARLSKMKKIYVANMFTSLYSNLCLNCQIKLREKVRLGEDVDPVDVCDVCRPGVDRRLEKIRGRIESWS